MNLPIPTEEQIKKAQEWLYEQYKGSAQAYYVRDSGGDYLQDEESDGDGEVFCLAHAEKVSTRHKGSYIERSMWEDDHTLYCATCGEKPVFSDSDPEAVYCPGCV